jgi:outer membrane protein
MKLSGALRAGAFALILAAAPAVAQAESLRQALESAYSNNPNIMSALLSVKASAEDVARAKAGKLPQITGDASLGAGFAQTGQGITFSDPALKLSLGYQQNIFDNFQTEAQIEGARALTEVSKYALRNEEQNVLLSAVQAYMNVVRDSQLVALRRDNVAFFEAQVDSSTNRLELGEGTKIEVSQAEARLAAATASYRAAQASLQTSQASYERWIGHKPKNLSTDFKFGGVLPKSLDDAIAAGEESHPAILSSRAAIRAAMANTDAAAAAFGPSLGLAASVCGYGCFSANPSQGGMTGQVGFSLSVPIYRGGSLGATVRKANLNQIKSEVDALAARDQVREAVISSWSTLQNATAQIASANSAVASGQLVVEGVVQERDVGQSTTLDVLNAQAELTQAREGLITATTSRIIASFALVAAAGRLSPAELGLNVEVKSADGYIATVEDVWAELRAIDE